MKFYFSHNVRAFFSEINNLWYIQKLSKKNPCQKSHIYCTTFLIYIFFQTFSAYSSFRSITKNYSFAIHLFSALHPVSLVLCNYWTHIFLPSVCRSSTPDTSSHSHHCPSFAQVSLRALLSALPLCCFFFTYLIFSPFINQANSEVMSQQRQKEGDVGKDEGSNKQHSKTLWWLCPARASFVRFPQKLQLLCI